MVETKEAEASVTDLAAHAATPRIDVFGGSITDKVELGDDVSWIEVKRMNEGERRKYLSAIQRPMKVSKTGEAEINFNPGADREALLQATIIDWNIMANDEEFVFSTNAVRIFMNSADVSIVDKVEEAARNINPWLLDEVSVEQLDDQIEELTKMRDDKLAEEAGND